MFSILSGIFLGMELLGRVVTVCLTFSGAVEVFFKGATPLYIPTNNVWGVQFLHILTNT
jgi:hypothetical protein